MPSAGGSIEGKNSVRAALPFARLPTGPTVSPERRRIIAQRDAQYESSVSVAAPCALVIGSLACRRQRAHESTLTFAINNAAATFRVHAIAINSKMKWKQVFQDL